jgi:hypothetical protein
MSISYVEIPTLTLVNYTFQTIPSMHTINIHTYIHACMHACVYASAVTLILNLFHETHGCIKVIESHLPFHIHLASIELCFNFHREMTNIGCKLDTNGGPYETINTLEMKREVK